MSNLPPSTAEDIAAAAELHVRPVQEWLNAVTVGGIVDHDPETGLYHLPREHAGLLTRAAGTLNLSNGLQFIGQMGKVEDDVVESFRTVTMVTAEALVHGRLVLDTQSVTSLMGRSTEASLKMLLWG